MDELRRFSALRRRLNALQQESYTIEKILDVTDWRGVEHLAEVQASTARQKALEEEIGELEYVLEFYEHSMRSRQALIISPYTVLMILAIVLALFVLTTLAAGVMAGAIRVR